MDGYILLDYWGQLVQDFKDSEKENGIEAYETEDMAREILSYIRYTRFRQWTLFVQKRGEEFEKMLEKLVKLDFNSKAVQRFLEDEELWKTTLELGAQ
jgi:hypothetical protein